MFSSPGKSYVEMEIRTKARQHMMRDDASGLCLLCLPGQPAMERLKTAGFAASELTQTAEATTVTQRLVEGRSPAFVEQWSFDRRHTHDNVLWKRQQLIGNAYSCHAKMPICMAAFFSSLEVRPHLRNVQRPGVLQRMQCAHSSQALPAAACLLL